MTWWKGARVVLQKSKGGENIIWWKRSMIYEAATYFLDPAESEDDGSLVLLHDPDAEEDGEGEGEDDEQDGEGHEHHLAHAAHGAAVVLVAGPPRPRPLLRDRDPLQHQHSDTCLFWGNLLEK